MKKKTILLESLIMISLYTGYAHAGINPGNYYEFQKIENDGDNAIISDGGEYTFTNGAELTSNITKPIIYANKDMVINVGNKDNETNFDLKLDNDEGSGISNTISNLTINATNTSINIDGNYRYGIDITDKKDDASNTVVKIAGNENTDFIINGNGFYAINFNSWYDNAKLEIASNNFYIGNKNESSSFNRGIYFYQYKEAMSSINITVKNDFIIDGAETSIWSDAAGKNSVIDINANTIYLNGVGPDDDKQPDASARGTAIFHSLGTVSLKAQNDINITAAATAIEFAGRAQGENDICNMNIISKYGNINIIADQFVGIASMLKSSNRGIDDRTNMTIQAAKDINISGADKGVFYEPGSRDIDIISQAGNIKISSDNIGFLATPQIRTGSEGTLYRDDVSVYSAELKGTIKIEAENGNVSILGGNTGLVVNNLNAKEYVLDGNGNNIYENGEKVKKDKGYFTTFNINANDVLIVGNEDYGIKAQNILANYNDVKETYDRSSYVNINSNTDINIFGGKAGILASLTRDEFDDRDINNRKNTNLSSNVNLIANGDINVQSNDYGIMAFENGNVNLHAKNGDVTVVSTDADVRKSSNIAAIYIESGNDTNSNVTNSKVNIQSDNGRINILSNNKSVWVSGNGGELDVTGVVNINSKIYGNEEGQHIALVAGMKNSNTKDASDNDKKGTVNIHLTGDIDSFITGDVVGARKGTINIDRQSGNGKLIVKGDILAGNTGVVNLNFGNGGYFEGRTDDYQDAKTKEETGNTFFDPHFTDGEVTERGQVKLDFGKNSVWKVTGQSWASEVKSDNALIDLTTAKSDRNEAGHALTIETLEGNTNFKVHLDGQRSNSDMIYIKNASGTYNVFLDDVVTEEDIGETGLRFMTTDDTSSSLKVNRISASIGGLYNINYLEGHDEYQTSTENDIYNDTEMTDAKPGTDSVDDFLEVKKDKNNSSITLSKTKETKETKTPEKNIDATNHKIIAVKERIESDVVRGIEDSARVNYNMGILLDRLNKRLGEARYIDGDEGLWIRMWHKNVGRDNQFETASNMYQIGYDKFKECDNNGKHRQGVAIDYMDADSDFKNIIGNGETNRKGIWLYDTWLGDKGHYSDYVFKWGHLENKFNLIDELSAKEINAEYNNNAYALSAEYGRKKMLNDEGWYIEPQTQLQYTHLTGADYQTNLGTNVSMESVNSLIGRVGFRLGKDIDDDKKSTFYVKADILHEFMGDQEINAYDKTGILNKTYENEGTWYDIGIGFSTMLSDTSYAYLDYERCFGNNNKNTYQINGGIRWTL